MTLSNEAALNAQVTVTPETLALALNRDLFSPVECVAHRRASPNSVENARLRAILDAAGLIDTLKTEGFVIAALRAELPADVAELVETWREVAALVAPAGTRFGEARRNAASCLRDAADALATLSRRNAELEAEVAAARREGIEEAARWVQDNWPHDKRTLVPAIRALGEKP